MNKEKQIVPQLRFPEFVDSWNVAKGENITIKISKGSSPKWQGFDYVDEGILFVTSENVRDGFLDVSKPKYLDYGFHEKQKNSQLKKGDILINIVGASIGRSTIFNLDIEANINQAVAIFRVKKDVSKGFVSYFLQLDETQKRMFGVQSESARPNLSLTNLKELLFNIPKNPKEQQKIANCLLSLDNTITAENVKLDLLKDHKKGLLQQLFPQEGETQPKYRFPEFENDGDWEKMTLGKLAKFRRGSFPQPYGLAKWYDDENGMPFIQVYDVDTNLKIKPKTKRLISELAAKQSVFIEKGTIIITIQGSIGRVAITQYDAYIDRTLLLFEEFFKPIDKLFFAYVIQLLFEIEKQKAPGGIIKTITKEVLTSFNIHLPNILEQQKIARCLSSVDELIESQTQKVKALKKHKKGLMQQLFPKVNSVEI